MTTLNGAKPFAPAQTNIALYEQMLANGYAHEAVETMRDAYLLAMRLFSSSYRASGKTFLAHLIGTVSILVEEQLSTTVLAAALLHSAYTHGDFGLLRQRIGERKRSLLRAAIGAEAEALVYAYTHFSWSEARLRAAVSSAEIHDGELLVMRLANELDDLGDIPYLATANAAKRRERAVRMLPLALTMARRLKLTELTRAFDAMRERLALQRPELCTIDVPESISLPPASTMPSLIARLRAAIKHAKRILGR